MLQRVAPTRPFHVLVATPAGATGQGGIDRAMAALRDELVRSGRGDLVVEFRATRGRGHILLSPIFLVGFLLRMLVLRASGRLDLLHVNLSVLGSTYRKLVVTGLARLLRVPYVLHLHGAEYEVFWANMPAGRSALIRQMFERAARVLVLGRMWQKFVASRAPGAADRIVILPNATEVPALPHRGGGASTHILFLGRIGARKGVPQLGEALRRMCDVPGWRATIAGDGAVEEARATAAAMGMADRIAFPGWVGPDAVASLIKADILVLPSFAENLPISVIEGMAAGLAVVATPVGAVEDIIHDQETGLLVPPGDVDALTTALVRLLGDPELRHRLGTAAQAVHREQLELGGFARRLAAIWREAAETGACADIAPAPLPREASPKRATADER